MISTWISGQEDGHATQVAINAVTGEVEGEPVAGIWPLVSLLTSHFLNRVQNKLAIFLFGLTQQTAEFF